MVGRKPYLYQERKVVGWCGPAVLAMGLAALGFPVSQEELAKMAPYDPDWGTDHESMLSGARAFVPGAYETIDKGLDELGQLAEKNVVILNFMDTELERESSLGVGNGEDGHYVLLDRLDQNDMVVVDSNPISPVDGGFRLVKKDWFERHFWDIGRENTVVERWALVIPAV